MRSINAFLAGRPALAAFIVLGLALIVAACQPGGGGSGGSGY